MAVKVVRVTTSPNSTTVRNMESGPKTQTSAFSETMLAKELSKDHALLYGPLYFWPGFEVHEKGSA